MKLHEVMTANLQCISPSSGLIEAAQMMRDADVGSIPVCEGDRIVGIITDRDMAIRCIAEGDNPMECVVSDHMTEDVVTANPYTDTEEALELMTSRQVRRHRGIYPGGHRAPGVRPGRCAPLSSSVSSSLRPRLVLCPLIENTPLPAHPEPVEGRAEQRRLVATA